MSEKKFGVWEQPKDGSANGQWTCGGTNIHHFETMEEAKAKANTWNIAVAYRNINHEARELPEAWWNLSASEIGKLIHK